MQKQTVKTFESTLFGSLHTFVDDKGAPWFVGRQVAEKLGFSKKGNTISNAMARHCPEKTSFETHTFTVGVLPQGVRTNTALISESDLYALVMKSKLEGAKAFQDWVTGEVLPSIRNHGGYHAEQPKMADQYADPELFAQINSTMADFGLAMANLTTMIVQQNQKIDKLAEKVASVNSGGPTEDDVPYGYEVRNRVWAQIRASNGAGCLNNAAFSRMLTSASWPEVRFMRFNRDGLLVPTAYLKPTHRYKGEEVTPEGLMNRVIMESTQVTEHKYTHPLIGDYLQ